MAYEDGPFTPTPALLSKVGSIVRHAEEFLSPGGHHLDAEAVKTLLADPEVVDWLAAMDDLALLPEKR